MLHHEALAQQLHDMTMVYQRAVISELEHARVLVDLIGRDEQLCSKVQAIGYDFLLPTWSGELEKAVDAAPYTGDYWVIGVDGSQIYPDRHQGIACYVINIGKVVLWYGAASGARLSSKPTLLFERNDLGHDYCGSTPDEVNCQRTEFEFEVGLREARDYRKGLAHPLVVFFDGSLIFWHLDHKDEATKRYFFSRYDLLMQEFYKEQVLYASYISLPKSRELVHVLCAAAHLPECGGTRVHFDCLVDTDLMAFFLTPLTRSGVFMHNANAIDQYDTAVRPCFFYLHNGNEIVRVEIPAWIALQEQVVDSVAAIVLSQSIKGNGYPICLAEAHEQAVVSNADREVFYHLLEKTMLARDGYDHIMRSQKSFHKKFLGI